MNIRTLIGQRGEQAVEKYLYKKGFSILERNYRERCGEIDLIVQNKETLCFVEIKTRTTKYFATSEVVTTSKQKKIIKTANLYILKKNIVNKVLRFDIAVVTGESDLFSIEYLENAFTDDARYPY